VIIQSPKNPNSHLTAKDRKYPSFPTNYLFQRGMIHGKVLDFGCGTGTDVAFLNSQNVDVSGYDPFYAPQYPDGRFDTILCHYVLNVLLPEEQVQVLMAVSELLRPTGRAYFTVRRDIKKAGYRNHIKFNQQVYQCNVILPLESITRAEHCEVYEYQHFNQLPHLETGCPFCSPSTDQELISESATVYAMLDKYPVSNGHTLIVPKQHIEGYFDLPERTKTACWLMVDRAKEQLVERYKPDGFNIGVNVGTSAGQTVPHVHIHLIPRWTHTL